jgi:hypothetical protein
MRIEPMHPKKPQEWASCLEEFANRGIINRMIVPQVKPKRDAPRKNISSHPPDLCEDDAVRLALFLFILLLSARRAEKAGTIQAVSGPCSRL